MPEDLLEEIETRITLKHFLEKIEMIERTDSEKINQTIKWKRRKAYQRLENSKLQPNKKVVH